MHSLSWQPGTRIVAGPDSLDEIGELAQGFGATKALIISDEGVAAAGHARRGADALTARAISVEVFADVQPNPTTIDVERGAAVAHDFQPDLIIGLGGGSAMDCAKGVNFVYTNGGRMEDYRGHGKAKEPMLPMVAVPTTAGTGSEVQSYALISDGVSHHKMACGDPKARPSLAILDPRLLLTTPRKVAAMAAIDAVSHAVESYVTAERNTISIMLSGESFRLLSAAIYRAFQESANVEVWGIMQWGACLAGLAIEQSMLGAAHALANPLTAHCAIPHGQAVAVCLPHVVRFNANQCGNLYEELVSRTDAPLSAKNADVLAEWLTELTRQLGLQTTLSSLAVEPKILPELAVEAAEQWTALHNPRPITAADAAALYHAAL